MTKDSKRFVMIDTHDRNRVMSEHATAVQAMNAAKRLEPKPMIPRRGLTPGRWRYLVRGTQEGKSTLAEGKREALGDD
jgi:hypothetical protein